MAKQKIVLFDIDYTIFDTDLFKKSKLQRYKVYDEVHDILARLQKVALLGILSEGNTEFQHTKLRETTVDHYFEKKHIHVVPLKNEALAAILHKYRDKAVFLVDDKLECLYLAKQYQPAVFTIWVK